MRRTHGVARVLLSTAVVATMAGVVAPNATAAEPAAACTWTPSILPMPADALTGEVDVADGNGGYAGTISYGADSEKGGPPVVWKNGKFTEYAFLDDPEYQKRVTVNDMNDAGTIVGNAYQMNGFRSAVRSRDGKLERLPELPGGYSSAAEGINDRGDIVGRVEVSGADGPSFEPVIWPADKPGTVEKLTGLPDTSAMADGIDQDGTVLVNVERDDSAGLYLWKNGKATKMVFPGKTLDYIPRGISNGRVIAEVDFRNGGWKSVLWDQDGKARVVARGADIRSINRDGQLVGRTDDPSWREEGVWNKTALDATLPWGTNRGLQLRVSSDDGTIAGRSWTFGGGRNEPTVWACR